MGMIVVETMLRAHGHVDFHNSFECCKRSQSVRQLLRTSTKRFHRGDEYMSVPPDVSEEDMRKRLHVGVDPNFFCHYLAFSGVSRSAGKSMSEEAKDHAAWMRHLEATLGDHPARALVVQEDNDADSERSVASVMSFNMRAAELPEDDSSKIDQNGTQPLIVRPVSNLSASGPQHVAPQAAPAARGSVPVMFSPLKSSSVQYQSPA